LSHKALARKYRPKSFADVATQGHVSETLQRAVATDRVGHAYLFCGPRGVGKTTLARVLAMALNCPDRSPEGEPCGVCESCERIWGGHTALDVVEIDAASNRGVDDARDLRERAMYAPSAEGRSKVYIVDEAHMLTREAWNALLKILEEPPPRVIFVFATTEPQKIQQSAAPILSRCQRFDFRRIAVADIVERLQSVLDQEDSPYAPEALRLIARKADGGMRDALSLVDQVISLTGGDVDAESVRRVLGLVDDERYLELLDLLAQGRHDQVFRFVDDLVDDGYDLIEFYHGLLDLLRTLLRLRLDPDADVDVQQEVRSLLLERYTTFGAGDLVRMLTAAAELESQGSLRRSPNPRLPIEMLLLRMSFLDRTVDIEELIRALGGAPKADGGIGSQGPPGGSRAAGTDEPVARSPEPSPAPAEAAGDAEHVRSLTTVVREALERSERVAVEPDRETPPESAAEAIEPSGDPLEAWARWLEDGRRVPRGLLAFLRTASVRATEGGTLEVRPVPGPTADRLREPAILDRIRTGLTPYVGRTPELAVLEPETASETVQRVSRDEVREDTLNALFRQEPRLRRAVEELDLELMD